MEKYYVSIQNCRIAKNRSEVSNYYEFETVMNAEQKQQLETLLLESGVKEIYQFLIGVATAEDKAYIKTILGE